MYLLFETSPGWLPSWRVFIYFYFFVGGWVELGEGAYLDLVGDTALSSSYLLVGAVYCSLDRRGYFGVSNVVFVIRNEAETCKQISEAGDDEPCIVENSNMMETCVVWESPLRQKESPLAVMSTLKRGDGGGGNVHSKTFWQHSDSGVTKSKKMWTEIWVNGKCFGKFVL